MEFYLIIFGILAFLSLIELFGLKQKQSLMLFLGSSIFIFILSFIRWEVGTDWEAYISYFNNIIDWNQYSDFEYGFSRINEFVKLVFDDYSVLLFVLGAILFLFQSSAIIKLSPFPITSLLFLWAISFGNAMFIRQTISTVILLWSVTYIQKSFFWRYLLMIAIAMLFHRTSVIFIFAWWIYKMDIGVKWLWIGVFFSCIMTSVIKVLFESYAGAFGPVVQYKLDSYLSGGENTFGSSVSLVQIIIKGVANKVIIFFALMASYTRISALYPSYKGLVNLYWFGIIIYFSTIGISVAFVRFSFAYDILQIVLVPILFKFISNDRVKLVGYVMFLLYLSMRLYVALMGNYFDLYVPFKTIFSDNI